MFAQHEVNLWPNLLCFDLCSSGCCVPFRVFVFNLCSCFCFELCVPELVSGKYCVVLFWFGELFPKNVMSELCPVFYFSGILFEELGSQQATVLTHHVKDSSKNSFRAKFS